MEEIELNKKNVEIYKQISKMLSDKVSLILENICKIQINDTYEGYIERVELSDDKVYITTHCNDEREHEYYSFPENYLYNDDYLNDVKEKVRLEKIKKENQKRRGRRTKKIENDKIIKQKNEKKEKELYEQLKKKFEGS